MACPLLNNKNVSIKTFRGIKMQIHLFISKSALAGNYLKDQLRGILNSNTVIKYQIPDDFGRLVSIPNDEPAVSVIMVANQHELSKLVQKGQLWDRYKTILILPNNELETINLAHCLRPIFIKSMEIDVPEQGMEHDFSDVISILEHINSRFNSDEQNTEFQ
jgi:hypothetical protein